MGYLEERNMVKRILWLTILMLLITGLIGLPSSSARGHSDLQGTATPIGDGSGKIAFVSARDENFEIYAMDADGNNERNLTNKRGNDWAPAWSPDGTQIAFISDRDGSWDIFLMNADGSNQHNLTMSK